MPRERDNRAIVRAIELGLKAHNVPKSKVKLWVKVLDELARTSKDDRVRVKAAQQLLAHNLKVLEMQMPAEMKKSQVEHTFPEEISVNIVKGGNKQSDEPEKSDEDGDEQ